jgi:hypothetical protein
MDDFKDELMKLKEKVENLIKTIRYLKGKGEKNTQWELLPHIFEKLVKDSVGNRELSKDEETFIKNIQRVIENELK